MGVSNGRYHSFLVRVWARKGHFVHGEITDTATHESLRFREFPRLLRFILTGLRRADDATLVKPEEVFTVVPGREDLAAAVALDPEVGIHAPDLNSRLTPD